MMRWTSKPGDDVGTRKAEMPPLPAAAQRFGHAHIVVAGRGRGAPHLADKTLQLVGKAAVLAIKPARVLEQGTLPVVSWQHFLTGEIDQTVTHRANVFRQRPCNRG